MRYVRHDDTYVIRFEDCERFPDRLLELLERESISSASLSGIGAMQRCRIAYFDIETCEYQDIDLNEQVEVLAIIGNVASYEDKPLVHAHVTLGRRDGTVMGGHLRHGIVRPTLELFLRLSPAPLTRAIDPKYGLPALDLEHHD